MEKIHVHLQGPALSRIVAGAWRWGSDVNVDTITESAGACDIRLDRQDWFAMLRAASGKDVP